MSGQDDSSERRMAYLEGRVAALEEALESRSRELRLVQEHLGHAGLEVLEAIRRGEEPIAMRSWGAELEGSEVDEAEVQDVLRALWQRGDGEP